MLPSGQEIEKENILFILLMLKNFGKLYSVGLVIFVAHLDSVLFSFFFKGVCLAKVIACYMSKLLY